MTTESMGSEETRVKQCPQRGKSSRPKPDAQVAHVDLRVVARLTWLRLKKQTSWTRRTERKLA